MKDCRCLRGSISEICQGLLTDPNSIPQFQFLPRTTRVSGKECELKSVPASKSSRLCARSSCQETRCSSPIRRDRSRQSLLYGGEQPAGDARPRPAVDDRLPGGLPQHVVLGWRKCEHLIQLAGEIGRIAGLEGC